MKNLVISHKKQLLLAAVICLFSIFAISCGKILSNFYETKNRINKEKQIWVSIAQNINSDLTQSQQKQWTNFATNNPEIFLRANTSKFHNTKNNHIVTDTEKIKMESSKNILANIVVSAREHINPKAKWVSIYNNKNERY